MDINMTLGNVFAMRSSLMNYLTFMSFGLRSLNLCADYQWSVARHTPYVSVGTHIYTHKMNIWLHMQTHIIIHFTNITKHFLFSFATAFVAFFHRHDYHSWRVMEPINFSEFLLPLTLHILMLFILWYLRVAWWCINGHILTCLDLSQTLQLQQILNAPTNRKIIY